MNVTELSAVLDATRLPSRGPDLDGIRRQGRRIQHRRRAAAAGVAAVTAALVAIPFTMLHDNGAPSETSFASNGNRVQDDSPEARFLLTAPFAAPVGTVVSLDMKAYVRVHGHSVGVLAVWAEQAGRRLAYGSRNIDGDNQVRRAGFVDAPLLPREDGILVQVPGTGDEPTYVGLIAVDPDGPATATVHTHSVDTHVQSGVSATADPGYLLVWVTATAGSEPGIDLRTFTVRGPGGHVLAHGTFR